MISPLSIKMKKIFSIVIIIFLLFQSVLPLKVFADNPISTPSAVTATPTTDPSTTPSPSPSSSVSPTQTQKQNISDTPTPTPMVTINATNSATATTSATSEANTGGNTITITPSATESASESTPSAKTASPTPTSNPTDTTIQTGKSISEMSVTNTVNTTTVNSQVVYQTINLFVDKQGNLDLSNPTALAKQIISQDPSNNPTYNVKVADINNTAAVSNQVTTTANTGSNTATGSGQVIINTGNAYAVTSLMNTVNVTLIDSTIHVITLNIYGNLTGNILLPNIANTPDSSASAKTDIATTNTASVTNTIISTTDTGNNSIVATDSATIKTGNATSVIQTTNVTNTTFWNAFFGNLFINLFGTWNGKFLGWGNLSAHTGGQSFALMQSNAKNSLPCSECSLAEHSTNNATVTNSITSQANTGDNTIQGGNGNISTGNAYSVVSITNFLNADFINSRGFFGFINIFGDVRGDIGQANLFPTPTPSPSPSSTPQPTQQQNNSSSNTSSSKEDGGQLWIEQKNNVGIYILPGDTVTFFVKIKNSGTGRVYGSHLQLTLFHDGQNMGGAEFSLGDIDAGKGIKLTTGIVLSQNAPSGAYSAVATVTGTTGNQNTNLSASSTSYFQLAPLFVPTSQPSSPAVLPHDTVKSVLGTQNKDAHTNGLFLLYALIACIVLYVFSRLLTSREKLAVMFLKQGSIKEKLRALRLFLF